MSYEYQVDVGGIMYGMDSIKSANIHQPLFPSLSVGNACSAEFTLSFWPSEPPARMAKVTPYTREKGSTAWTKPGEFWIDTRQRVGTLLNMVCYDAMLRAELTWDPGAGVVFPMTMKEAADNIASLMETELDSRTVINDAYTIPEPPGKLTTMREVLCNIAAAHGGNWIVTAEGKLLLVPLFGSMPPETHYLMANYVTITSDKSRRKAYKLCLFLGMFGAHRFYVGKRFTGFIYLFTLGLFFFGWLHDLGVIRRGKFRDNVGAPLRE